MERGSCDKRKCGARNACISRVRVCIYIYFLLLRVYILVCVYVCESETLEIAKTRRTKENRGDVREGPG